MRADNISHFICRMLYCQEENTKYKFISMEKRILENRLRLQLSGLDKKDENLSIKRGEVMKLLKRMMAFFKGKNAQDYTISNDEWT